MAVTFFYGISGTLKTTTVDHLLKAGDCGVVRSKIKTWKNLESGIFSGLIDYNDLNYALLHLCILEHEVEKSKNKNILVERGITDMFYFSLRNTGMNVEDDVIYEAVNKEEFDICEGNINKILLIQKDTKFIENVVLKDPVRAKIFPNGLNQYLENQEDYIEFTKKYNSITQIIEIKDAEKYLAGM